MRAASSPEVLPPSQAERYELSWPGKRAAMREAARPCAGSLLPRPEQSLDPESTQHLLIEGDNLDALKLLRATHAAGVKLVYIDPPYNTGRSFIYSDNFRGSVRKAAVRTHGERSERVHAKWLSMMWPRLALARELLRDDGAIFVSCDDNEVHGLRALLDEIFGADNFVATVVWQKVFAPKNTARLFSADHEYVVVYARDAAAFEPGLLPRTEAMGARYRNPDDDPRGPWTSGDLSARNPYGEGSYPITCPSGRVIPGPPAGCYWRVSKQRLAELDRDHRIHWGKRGDATPRLKRFLSEVKPGKVPQTLWLHREVGHTQDAKRELMQHVRFEHTDNVLDTVKPVALIRRMLQIATAPDRGDVVLDFFAGSGVTGHAVLAQNAEDGGNRRFVLVQLPERLPLPEAKLATIADIAKERLRSASAGLRALAAKGARPAHAAAPDLGFRVLQVVARQT